MSIPIIQYYCNLYTYSFDNYHTHVITGNLDIVAHQEIRTLLSKGLNFCVQRFNADITYNTILSAGELYIIKVSTEAKLALNTFIPWKTELLHAVKGKIYKIKAKPVYTVLEQHRNVLFLTKLQEHFVLVPVNKM